MLVTSFRIGDWGKLVLPLSFPPCLFPCEEEYKALTRPEGELKLLKHPARTHSKTLNALTGHRAPKERETERESAHDVFNGFAAVESFYHGQRAQAGG